jgi:hypothetical protein
MNGKWSDNETKPNGNADKFGELFKDEYAVILLQGKNSFGDLIFSYVKVSLPNIKRLHAALNSGEDFSPSNFGEILIAGKGVPSDELRAEMASSYNTLQQSANAASPAPFTPASAYTPIPIEKKAWDEF